jgi:hypothetical protein
MPYSLDSLYKKNVTTILLLWTVDISYAEAEYYGLVDAFIGDMSKPTFYGYYIFVLVDKSKAIKPSYGFFDNKYVTDSYQCSDNFTIYKYKIPRDLENDFEVICSGKYSTVSNYFIQKFPSLQSAINFKTHKKFFQNDRAQKLISREWYFKRDYVNMLNIEIPDNTEWWKDFNLEKEILSIEKYYI